MMNLFVYIFRFNGNEHLDFLCSVSVVVPVLELVVLFCFLPLLLASTRFRPRYNSFRRERNADSEHFSTNDTSNSSSNKGRRWDMDSENGSDGHADRKVCRCFSGYFRSLFRFRTSSVLSRLEGGGGDFFLDGILSSM